MNKLPDWLPHTFAMQTQSIASLPSWLAAAVCFVLGLAIGSFLNVVIYRIPRGESIVAPGSRCPGCSAPIGARDNIPLLSFLILRGRCRRCNQIISPLYPFVEITCALIFLVIGLFSGLSWYSAAQMWFAATMLAVMCIDASHEVIPDEITYPSFPLAIAFAALKGGSNASLLAVGSLITPEELGFSPIRAALTGTFMLFLAVPLFWVIDQLDQVLFSKYLNWKPDDSDNALSPPESEDSSSSNYGKLLIVSAVIGAVLAAAWLLLALKLSRQNPENFLEALNSFYDSLAGIATGGGILWVIRTIYFYVRGIEGMGLGDVKLMCIIGAFLGWQGAIAVLVVGSVGGLLFGIYLAFRHKTGLKTRLPLGVFLGIAALLTQLGLILERPAV